MTMHKTSELEGMLLDRAVGTAEGYEIDPKWGCNMTIRENGGSPSDWSPSTDWAQGGPIIERDAIALQPDQPIVSTEVQRAAGMPAVAWTAWQWGDPGRRMMLGATPLVAAMRLRVARAFGDEVELP